VSAHPFDRATSVAHAAGDHWVTPLDAGWFGGAAPHGGHLAAQILRAIKCSAGDGALRPRSLTVHFVSRAEPGQLEINAVTERGGRTLSTFSARATQDGSLVALAVAALGRDREGPLLRDARMPEVPPPDELRGPSERARAMSPPVWTHYETRFAIGTPFSGGPARAGGWIRPREPRPPDDLLVTALTDMWMPPVFMSLDAPSYYVPTVELTVNYVAATEGLPGEGWYLTVFTAPAASDGYFREEGEVWSQDGRLLARSSQLGVFRRRT
jgi:acyl-CoA thioesterase